MDESENMPAAPRDAAYARGTELGKRSKAEFQPHSPSQPGVLAQCRKQQQLCNWLQWPRFAGQKTCQCKGVAAKKTKAYWRTARHSLLPEQKHTKWKAVRDEAGELGFLGSHRAYIPKAGIWMWVWRTWKERPISLEAGAEACVPLSTLINKSSHILNLMEKVNKSSPVKKKI